MPTAFHVRPVGDEFAGPILAILNDAIVNSTALYEYAPRPPEAMAPWFAAKAAGGWTVLGAVTAAGELAGFATFGPFRAWPAYKYTAEHSVYVRRDHRGKGVGSALMAAVIEAARARGLHVLVAGIDGENAASVELHRKFGFERAGVLREVGFKFGRWLDLEFHTLRLDGPEHPVDG